MMIVFLAQTTGRQVQILLFCGDIDVGDGCWGRNVLVTTKLVTTLLDFQRRTPTSKRCHRHPQIGAKFKSPRARCHQHNCHWFCR